MSDLFNAPQALWLALLLPLIVLMYLLRLRRVERSVSSTYLWRQMVRDVQANAPWQRLRRNLLMVLQLLFLALLILALARPQTNDPDTISAQAAIFIIDTSASMAATDVSPTRLEAAKGEARRLVGNLAGSVPVTIIAAGPQARVLASQSTDRRLALQAIESLRVEAGSSDLGVALQLASAIARRRPDTQTIVLSDGNADLPARLAIQGKLDYRPIGLKADNQAVALLNLQTVPGGTSLTAFAQVVNYGPQDATRRLALYADGQLVDAYDLALPSGGQQAILAEGLLTTTQSVTARLLPATDAAGLDYLPLDDEAVAVHRPSRPISVTLVSQGNLFLETGLSLLPDLHITRFNTDAARLPAAGLTVFDSTVPTGTLPAGALLFINPLRSSEYFSVTGSLALQSATAAQVSAGSLRPAQENDPLLTYVSLEGVHVLDGVRIPLPTWARAVIVTNDPAGGAPVPLLFAGEVDGRRIAVLAFDLRRSDLPLNIAFPILLANLSSWLAPGGSGIPEQIAPGAPLTLSLPPAALLAGQTALTVTRPDGSRETLQANTGPVTFADTRQTGVYTVDFGDGQPVQFAVNLFAPQESRLEPAQTLAVTGLEAATSGSANAQGGRREWWRWLAAIALLLLMAEWLVYHRPTLAMLRQKLRR